MNVHNTLSNGFTPKERLDCLHFEMADWHAVNKCLGVGLSHYFVEIAMQQTNGLFTGVICAAILGFIFSLLDDMKVWMCLL